MTSETMPTLAELQAIRAKTAAHIHRTPMMRSRYLSGATGFDVTLKCELFQRTGSFKPRGMLARLFHLAPEERGRGAIIGGIAMAREAAGKSFRLFGVEPEGAAGMTRSLEAGKPMRLEKVATIADGLGAPFVGDHCFPIVRDKVEKVVVLPDSAIVE